MSDKTVKRFEAKVTLDDGCRYYRDVVLAEAFDAKERECERLRGGLAAISIDAPTLDEARKIARAALEDQPEEVDAPAKTYLCPHCHGCGKEAGYFGLSQRPCKTCGGSGEVGYED